jgi:general stress protein 26
MPETTTQSNARELLWELVKDIKFAMFTTRADGRLRSRPMTTQNSEVDERSSLWFFMSRGSEAVNDIGADPVVNVAYADPGRDAYVSVSGEAAVVEDRAKKEQLWSKLAEAWFPGGADDPDLALVEVRIEDAEYWDVKESKVTQLFKMARAAVVSEPPSGMGEHGEVHMAREPAA